MSNFDAKQAINEIKETFGRLMVSEIIQLMDNCGVPETAKVGSFHDQYLPKRLEAANVHQLAALSGVLRSRTDDEASLPSPKIELDYSQPQSQQFNIFISHSAEQAQEAMLLKEYFAFGGLDSFVAHDDIEPGSAWVEAIVTNLDKADVMLTMVSEESVNSIMCNQEIGFALGKELPVVSLKDDVPPPGLIEPMQAVERLSLDSDKNVTLRLIDAMMQYPQLGPKLTDKLVETLVSCTSPSDSFKVIGFCRKALAFSSYATAGQLYELRKAARENDQIARFASGRGPELIESMCIEFEERLKIA